MTETETGAAITEDATPRLHVSVVELERVGAPYDVVERVRELYPDGVDVTEQVCLTHVDEFDFQDAAQLLLDDAGRTAFREAEREAREVYRRQLAVAFARGADVTAANRATQENDEAATNDATNDATEDASPDR